MKRRFGLVLLSWLLLPLTIEAKSFRTDYLSFELPDNWSCQALNSKWVCRADEESPSRALIILTAKEVGPADSIQAFKKHLSQPKSGSEILHTKSVLIQDHEWVDSWHLGSELKDYYTRYFATIKNRLAIAVTFSAQKDAYAEYSKEFFKAIKSLNIHNTSAIGNFKSSSGTVQLPGGSAAQSLEGANTLEAPSPFGGATSSKQLIIYVLGGVLALGALVFLLKKRS